MAVPAAAPAAWASSAGEEIRAPRDSGPQGAGLRKLPAAMPPARRLAAAGGTGRRLHREPAPAVPAARERPGRRPRFDHGFAAAGLSEEDVVAVANWYQTQRRRRSEPCRPRVEGSRCPPWRPAGQDRRRVSAGRSGGVTRWPPPLYRHPADGRGTRGCVARRKPPGCVHHSDRGSQFAAQVYRDVLATNGLVGSDGPARQSLRQRKGGELHEP